MDTLLTKWTEATTALPWGAKRVFRETFQAVADGQIHLVYGSDYRDGKPCLVNAVGAMLQSGGGNGIPMKHFGTVVNLFDRINRALEDKGVNTPLSPDIPGVGYVTPMAADVFLHHFADVSEEPEAIDGPIELPVSAAAYIEPSDEQLAKDWMESLTAPAPEALEDLADAGDPIALHVRGFTG